MTGIMIRCIACGEVKEMWGHGMCRNCLRKERYYAHGGKSMRENKKCALFLGVHVAEQVLSKVFKNVKQMPNGNPGFDFECSKGMKVDVKSSTFHKYCKTSGSWIFHIRKNKVADYFLCLAFDNRKDLTPQHVWLIPGKDINHLVSNKISLSTISKWSKYEKDINKVISCCDTMKHTKEPYKVQKTKRLMKITEFNEMISC